MKSSLRKLALPGLRTVLGIVVFLESLHFLLSPHLAREFAQTGLPLWIRPALGGSEAIAALLFLIPAVTEAAGYLLLAVFAAALGVHLSLGDYNVGALLVYAAAVIACIGNRHA